MKAILISNCYSQYTGGSIGTFVAQHGVDFALCTLVLLSPQVHDEVMLEGPKESAEVAMQRVVAAMRNPWVNLVGADEKDPLLVELAVDCKTADTWYEAK